MQVTVVFNADTGKYESNLAGMDKKTEASAQAVATAKNKILAYHNEQIRSAQSLGKSYEDMERIAQRSASSMANVTETNAKKIIVSIDSIRERNAKMRAELESLPKVPGGAGGHNEITDRMATSGVVRWGDGNGGIRATENFISSIPGAGKAMQALFPIVGAAGLAGLLFNLGEKGYEAFEKIRHAVTDTQRAFNEMHGKDQTHLDDLALENQRIQDQIDKLSGHPNNGLATAILEAKKMADGLLTSLQADRKEMEALFKEHSVGRIQSFFTGIASTAGQEKNILGDEDKLDNRIGDINDRFDVDSAGVKDLQKLKVLTDRRNTAVHDAVQAQIDNYKREVGRLQEEESKSQQAATYDPKSGVRSIGVNAIDNSAKIQELQNVIRHMQARSRSEMLNEDIYAGNMKLGGVKQNRDNALLSSKADEKWMKGLQQQADELERNGATQKAIYDFWKKNQSAYDEGSARFALVAAKTTPIAKAGAERVSRAIALADPMQGNNTTGAMDILTGRKEAKPDEGQQAYDAGQKAMYEWRKADAKKAEEAQKAQERADLGKANSAAQYRMANVAIAEQTGQISKLDAAQQRANIHAQQYANIQAQLKVDLANAQKTDNPADAVNAQAALDKSAADRNIQINEDAAATAAASWKTSLENAYDQWYQHAKDTAGQVRELFNQGINGANDNLVNMMSGDYKRGDWKRYGHSMFKSAAGDLLEQGEAKFLGPLGMGKKADGSEENPFHVVIAGQGGAGSGGGILSHIGGLGKIFRPFNGNGGSSDGSGDDSGDGSDSGSGIGGFFKSVFGAIAGAFHGGKALGGGVDSSGFFDVGEMGRERVWLPKGSSVQPHNQMGGGGAVYSINVANGVTPEQVDMRVRAALQEAHPHIVRASVQAVHDHQQRQPRRS